MDLQKFAKILQIKHGISLDDEGRSNFDAGEETKILAPKHPVKDVNVSALESFLRKRINTLWDFPHKIFNILASCAASEVVNAKTPHEMKAFAGWKFVKEVIGIIDDLKKNMATITPGDMRNSLLRLVNLIETNKDLKFTETGRPSELHGLPVPEGQTEVQFPHLAALISEMFPVRKKFDDRLKNKDFQGKARTGLGRILGLSIQMLEDLQELEVAAPEKFTFKGEEDIDQDLPSRFKAQKTRLSPAEIVSFIRSHGDEFGIRNTDDWEKVVRHDPKLLDQLSSTVYALKSGKHPRNALEMKEEIKKILNPGREVTQLSNKKLFENMDDGRTQEELEISNEQN